MFSSWNFQLGSMSSKCKRSHPRTIYGIFNRSVQIQGCVRTIHDRSSVDIGRLTPRTTTIIDRVQRRDTPPLVNLGVSDSLRADIGLREFADYD